MTAAIKARLPLGFKIRAARWRNNAINGLWSLVPLSLGPKPKIFVLGNQKSGTTVIAALVAHAAGLDVTLDIDHFRANDQRRLARGDLALRRYIRTHRTPFLNPIVKEPGLTFFYPQLRDTYPDAKFVFIVRDPRDNIRSILNRLQLPGNLSTLPTQPAVEFNEIWRMILRGSTFGEGSDRYIVNLAARWNQATDVYLANREQFILQRYEAFLQDKAGTIKRLTEALGLKHKQEIAHLVDRQYQRKGRQVDWQTFFGEINLQRIEQLCAKNMNQLVYSPVAISADERPENSTPGYSRR